MTDLKASPVFLANLQAYNDPAIKIIVNQGGTRSGKTYSIMQLLCYLHTYQDNSTSVVSKTLPHLKKGCVRDFKRIMNDNFTMSEKKMNNTDLIYRFRGEDSYIEFFCAMDGKRLRGPGRDDLFINEVNLLSYDEWKQLTIRTRGKIIVDYNPVDEFHWIYDKVLPRKDCQFIQSSYLDNIDFLPQSQIDEIEMLKNEDNTYWKVFGLGERCGSLRTIYTNVKVENFTHQSETIYGVDFGYNAPTAMVKASVTNNTIFVEEKLYDRELTNNDLMDRLPDLVPNQYSLIYADCAEPARIADLQNNDYNVVPADKRVKDGIDYLKRYKIVVHPESTNLIKEIKSYKWKEDNNGNALDEPVKYNDHLMDALRYCIYSHRQNFDDLPMSTFPNVHFRPRFSEIKNLKYQGYK